MDDRYVNMYNIPKRGPKVLVYKDGRLTINNIEGGWNSMQVSDICHIPILHEVGYERETTAAVYISLFIYPREVLMVPRVTGGGCVGI